MVESYIVIITVIASIVQIKNNVISLKKAKMINIGEVKVGKTEKVKVGKIKQYTRNEINIITSKRFCERHNIKNIKEYFYKKVEESE